MTYFIFPPHRGGTGGWGFQTLKATATQFRVGGNFAFGDVPLSQPAPDSRASVSPAGSDPPPENQIWKTGRGIDLEFPLPSPFEGKGGNGRYSGRIAASAFGGAACDRRASVPRRTFYAVVPGVGPVWAPGACCSLEGCGGRFSATGLGPLPGPASAFCSGGCGG
jgi:hypothetical protein